MTSRPSQSDVNQSNANQRKAKANVKAVVSLAILLVVSIQIYTSIVRVAYSGSAIPFVSELPEDPGLYPFVNYPMYRGVQPEGISVPRHTLIATFEDGTEQQLKAGDFGLSSYWFNTGVVQAFIDKDDLQIAQYVDAYQKVGGKPFVALRLDNSPLTITRGGVVEEKPALVKSVLTDVEKKDMEKE